MGQRDTKILLDYIHSLGILEENNMIFKYEAKIEFSFRCSIIQEVKILWSENRENVIQGLSSIFYQHGKSNYDRNHIEYFRAFDDEKEEPIDIKYDREEIEKLADEIQTQYGNRLRELERNIRKYSTDPMLCDFDYYVPDIYSTTDPEKYPLTPEQIKINEDNKESIERDINAWEKERDKIKKELSDKYNSIWPAAHQAGKSGYHIGKALYRILSTAMNPNICCHNCGDWCRS